MNDNYSELESIISYQFNDRHYLETALTHSSYANERLSIKCENYERQEFLGDAVLELVSSDILYHAHTDLPEGELTKLRASYVCEPALAECARAIDLEAYIRLGRGEEGTGGRSRDSIVSDVLEALTGGIYLDGGIEPATEFIRRFIIEPQKGHRIYKDAKSELQIRAQARGSVVTYEVTGESGPDHAKVFKVDCLIDGKPKGSGSGKTKKSAQQAAAADVLGRF